MKKIRMMVSAAAVCVLLNGCVWHDYSNPAIEGIVTNKGQPLPGVRVALSAYDEVIEETRTDANGHFSLKARGEWSVFIPIGPQDRVTHWSVLLYPEGTETITGYEQGGIGGFFSGYSSGDRVNLNCDIARYRGKTDRYTLSGVCQ